MTMTTLVHDISIRQIQPSRAAQEIGISTRQFYGYAKKEQWPKQDGAGREVTYAVPQCWIDWWQGKNPHRVPRSPEEDLEHKQLSRYMAEALQQVIAMTHEIKDLVVETTTYKLLSDQGDKERQVLLQRIHELEAENAMLRAVPKRLWGLFPVK
jgi:hypothetical protein